MAVYWPPLEPDTRDTGWPPVLASLRWLLETPPTAPQDRNTDLKPFARGGLLPSVAKNLERSRYDRDHARIH